MAFRAMMQTPRKPRKNTASPDSSGKKARNAVRSICRTNDQSDFTPGKELARVQYSPERNSTPVKATIDPILPVTDANTLRRCLPEHYSLLLQQFSLLEEVCGLFRVRGQVPTLKDIIPNVERVSGRRFNSVRLHQILALVPESFRLEDGTVVQTRKDGIAIAGRLSPSETNSRYKALECELLKRVEVAREGKECFDIETDCPVIIPFCGPTQQQTTCPVTPRSETPRGTRQLSLTASPVTPLNLPISTTPRTPRDKSLTPREELAAMRERVKAKSLAQANSSIVEAKELEVKLDAAERGDALAMVSVLAKKFYQKGHNSVRLSLLVADLNRGSVRFGSAIEIEKLIRRISSLVPEWLQIAVSEFWKGAEVVTVSQNVSFAAVQKKLRDNKQN